MWFRLNGGEEDKAVGMEAAEDKLTTHTWMVEEFSCSSLQYDVASLFCYSFKRHSVYRSIHHSVFSGYRNCLKPRNYCLIIARILLNT